MHKTIFGLTLNLAGEKVPVFYNGENVVSSITNEKIHEFDTACGFTLKHEDLLNICKQKIARMQEAFSQN